MAHSSETLNQKDPAISIQIGAGISAEVLMVQMKNKLTII